MDINAIKLGRLKEFFNDDGEPSPEAVAKVLKAKAENTSFLRGYVEAAAAALTQPELLVAFDAAITKPAAAAPASAAPSTPPVENVVESKPETQTPAPKTPVKLPAQTAPTPAFVETPAGPTPTTGKPTQYRFRDDNGLSTDLVVVHDKNGVVILEKKPVAELVTVTLKGTPVELNLTNLRTLPAGDTVQTIVGEYPVATLLVIADAAKA
jgi:hypothetical protein